MFSIDKIFFIISEFFNSKLPPVPEEEDVFRSGGLNNNYPELDLMPSSNQMSHAPSMDTQSQSESSGITQQQQTGGMQNLQYTPKTYTQAQSSTQFRNNMLVARKVFSPERKTHRITFLIHQEQFIGELQRRSTELSRVYVAEAINYQRKR